MTHKQNLKNFIEFLKCLQCGSNHFVVKAADLECRTCMTVYPIRHGVPIFTTNPEDTKLVPFDHVSNQLSDEVIDWLKEVDGYSLNIGGGATKTKIPRCIELEYSIYKNTDVVGDAHHLPFKDKVFDAVICFNVFEHLYNPFTAAREILRVLKPGGKVIVHTAFLQPLHEEPVHYYNATKYGVMNWFSEFDIETCNVSENFNPAFTIGWLAHEIIHAVQQVYGTEVSQKLEKTTLNEWSKIWSNPTSREGFLWETLIKLPPSKQERFSAGFELKAIKPITVTHDDSLNLEAAKTKVFYLPTEVSKSEETRKTDEKRLLVLSRLQAAKICESMGDTPWKLVTNSEYELCKEPCISVIVTLFNYSDYIYECLDSVCNSDLRDLPEKIEVLIIDDCSTDNSASRVEDYLSRATTPMCLVKKYFNTGLADARNVGLKVARSPYVFILDADNWIYPNCLAVLYNAIKSSNYAATYGKIRKFDNLSKQEIGLLSFNEWNISNLVKDPYIDAMAMLDKNIVLKVGGYSTELVEYGWFGWEDYDLWLKVAQLGYSCKLVPEVLSSYRTHSSSMINTTNKYTLSISKYFTYKFSDLAKLHDTSDRVFGSWRSEIDLEPHQKLYPKQNLAESQELQQAQATIKAMQSSKFWKLRNRWFKLKKFLRLAKSIDVKV